MKNKFVSIALGIAIILFIRPILAEKYLPPGYGANQSVEGMGWNLDIGYKRIAEDDYLTLKPLIEIPLFKRLRVGLQIPLDVLIRDNDPKGEKKIYSIRPGTYDDTYDYTKLISYIRYGTHLYFNPNDSFNWSLYYGAMAAGYIGHKSIVYRYANNYDPTVYRAGMMADVNNNWGGIEVFQSDVWRKEVIAGRAYIRPLGILFGTHDIFSAHSGNYTRRYIALSISEQRDPEKNGGVFFRETGAKRGGAIGQQFHSKIGDEDFNSRSDVKFEEYKDPVTGETQVRALPIRDRRAGETESGFESGEKSSRSKGGRKSSKSGKRDSRSGSSDSTSDEEASPWGRTFWSRWSIGYTIARDHSAPIELERDGSENFVIDPETGRPRTSKDEVFTIVGMDTEFRLSPFRWLELTPYADMNRVKYLDNSEGLHIGIDSGLKLLGGFLKFSFRPEYREFNANYLPVYFDSYYTVERTAYLSDGSGNNAGQITGASSTKLNYLKTLPNEHNIKKGYFVEVFMELRSFLIVETTYEDYDGLNNSRFFIGFFVPNIMGLFMNGYYTKKGFDQPNEATIYDDRSLAAGELGYMIYKFFYFKVTYERTWQYDATFNGFVAKDERSVNFGFSSSL